MIAAIVLAAGESRRMGTQKLLLPFGSVTVVETIVDELSASAVDEIVVVVGHEGERVARVLADRPVKVVANADYADGMLSSVRCGLASLPPDCDAVLIALGDQPEISRRLVDKMIDTFAGSEKGILVPVHEGRRGHPLLFSAGYIDEIMSQYDDEGLRGLLHAHPDEVNELDVPTDAVLADMDYPEDYAKTLARRNEPKPITDY
jgi:molybdenum cofactor cytidylyltransferase